MRVRQSREEFLDRYGLSKNKRVLTLLPGSRAGEARRHMATLLEAAAELRRRFDLNVVLATPHGFRERGGRVAKIFGNRSRRNPSK